jgi:hypothetical protein
MAWPLRWGRGGGNDNPTGRFGGAEQTAGKVKTVARARWELWCSRGDDDGVWET